MQYGGKRVEKRVVDMDHADDADHHLLCSWDTCDRDGYECHKVRIPDGANRNLNLVFCSERHRQYFLHSTRDLGNLPPGFRLSVL